MELKFRFSVIEEKWKKREKRTQNTIAIKITNICSREKDLDKEPGLNHGVTDVQA
jgi:hypothetical protein